jgi:8-oxo-dGTP pyrophosphatase MutT (NUDIX family)
MTAPHAGQRESAQQIIAEWFPIHADEESTRAEFDAAFGPVSAPVQRDQEPTHATASCFVFDPSLHRTLLVFHRKGRFWVQPGGHLEPSDPNIPGAAFRELAEETGLPRPRPADIVAFDLDHHQLASGFGGCASHLDFGVAVLLEPTHPVAVSEESHDVRWWKVDELPQNSAPGLPARIYALLRRIEHRDRA